MLGDDIYRGIKNRMTRREFLKGLAVVVGSALLGCSAPTKKVEAPQHPASAAATPTPETTPESAASSGAKFPNPAQEFGYPYFPACKFEEGYNVPLDKSGRPIPVSEIESREEPFFYYDDGSRLSKIDGIRTKWVVSDVTDYVEAYSDEVLKRSGLIFPEDENKLDLVKPKKLLLEFKYTSEGFISKIKDRERRKILEKFNKDGFIYKNTRAFTGSYTVDKDSLPKFMLCIITNTHTLCEKMGYDTCDTVYLTIPYVARVPLTYIRVEDVSEQAINKMIRNAGESPEKVRSWFGGNEKYFMDTLRTQDVSVGIIMRRDGTYYNGGAYIYFSPPKGIKTYSIRTTGKNKPPVTPEQRKLLKPYIESSLKKLWG